MCLSTGVRQANDVIISDLIQSDRWFIWHFTPRVLVQIKPTDWILKIICCLDHDIVAEWINHRDLAWNRGLQIPLKLNEITLELEFHAILAYFIILLLTYQSELLGFVIVTFNRPWCVLLFPDCVKCTIVFEHVYGEPILELVAYRMPCIVVRVIARNSWPLLFSYVHFINHSTIGAQWTIIRVPFVEGRTGRAESIPFVVGDVVSDEARAKNWITLVADINFTHSPFIRIVIKIKCIDLITQWFVNISCEISFFNMNRFHILDFQWVHIHTCGLKYDRL